jgi:hypothetical protein
MKKNLERVCCFSRKEVKISTLYKWAHIKKFPGLFCKLSGALLIDLDKFDELIENGRIN